MSPRTMVAALLTGTATLLAATPTATAGGFHGVGRWLLYPDGRVFVPHGVNLVVTRAPYWHSWFSAADARFLASEGFTLVRTNILPRALEPEPGTIDLAYAQHFVDRAALLGRYGIAALPALNQDDYAEECGGDGFPAWALLAPCGDGVWAPFWSNAAAADGVGLQDHLIAWWQAVLPRFADRPNVLGYDLLNEPAAPSAGVLGAFWQRTVAALAPAASGRVLFVEGGQSGRPDVPGVLARGTGYAGHVYCWDTLREAFAGRTPGAAAIGACIRHDRLLVSQHVSFATRHAYPLLVGEFGASDELREQAALVDALGAAFVPWAAYAYSTTLDSSGTASQALLEDDRKPGSQGNAKQAKLDALVVPYPLATAGRPLTWRFDRRRRVVTFTYSTTPVGPSLRGDRPTVVFVPARVYRTGYAVAVTGATVVSKPTAPWLELRNRRGARRVSVTIRPRAGSTTRTPLQANRCGYDLRPCGPS